MDCFKNQFLFLHTELLFTTQLSVGIPDLSPQFPMFLGSSITINFLILVKNIYSIVIIVHKAGTIVPIICCCHIDYVYITTGL